MKHTRFALIVLTMLIGASLLSACSGAAAANAWPGVTVTEGALYSAVNNRVYSMNPVNGAVNWQFPAEDAKTAFYASPLVIGDLIVAGDFDHSLHGLNKANGAEQWVFAEAKGRWIAAPILAGDLIIAPNADREVFALNQNGMLQWKFETKGPNWAEPAADGDNVYVSSMDHSVYALRLTDGKQIWSTDLGGAIVHSQILSEDGVLYVGTLGSEIIALNAKNGKVIWRGKTPGSIWGQAILKDGVLYVGDQSGKITAFETKNGSIAWSIDAGGPVIGTGTIIDDGLYFGTENGSLVKFNTSGQKVWNISVNGKLYSDIVVSGDNIIGAVTGNDKLVQAFDKDGKEIWGFIPAK